MLFQKNEKGLKEIPDLLKLFQITPPDKIPQIDVAEAVFEGNRYPKTGTGCNKISTMVYIVKSGSAKIFIDNEEFIVKEGDVIVFLPMRKYYVEPEKGFKVYIVSTPAWSPEQYVVG